MQVWTYPDKRMEEFGAIRWQVEWWTLRPGAQVEEEHDPDRDVIANVRSYKTREAAVAAAKRVVSKSFYGCATVEKQRVDWFVEEDRIAEWQGIGEIEEITPDEAAA